MIGHRIECGTRATAIALAWGDVLGPDAAFTWLSFGCHLADLALEGKKIDDDERKVPGHQADEEASLEESRKSATADAAESSNDEHHDTVEGKDNFEVLRSARSEFIPCGYPLLSMRRRELSAFSIFINPLLYFWTRGRASRQANRRRIISSSLLYYIDIG